MELTSFETCHVPDAASTRSVNVLGLVNGRMVIHAVLNVTVISNAQR